MKKKEVPVVDEDGNTDPLNTVCDLKWNYPIFHMERGEFRNCCRTPSKKITDEMFDELGVDAFQENEDMLESRLALIKGKRHQDCRSCWVLEDAGMSSPRHNPDRFFEQLKRAKLVDRNIPYSNDTLKLELDKIDSLDHPALKSKFPYMLEVSLGNTCDMKCMYCSHHYSTQWAAERIKYKEITQEQYDREFPKASDRFKEYYWKWFDSAKMHLGRLGAIGGEPLIMPEFYSFMERTIEAVAPINHLRKKKMVLWIVTNLNTPHNYLKKFLDYMPRLTECFDVEILVSMEAVGKRAEYIRNGLDWDRFTNNLDTLLNSKFEFEFGFISSINALSIATTMDFIKFVENLYEKYNRPVSLKQAVVNYPSYQSPLTLTEDFCKYLDEVVEYMKSRNGIMPPVSDFYGRWDQYTIFLENLSNSIRNNKDERLQDKKKFASWFDLYDKRRRLDFKETFPEYIEFYEYCKSL